MKGRTTCPNCNHQFILAIPDDMAQHETTCPECGHQFIIRQCSSDEPQSGEECGWEEHGEPRKTILSSMRPRTSKPDIASFLLLSACVFGFFTAGVLMVSDTIIIPIINFDFTFLIDIFGIPGLSIVIGIFSCFAFAGFLLTLKRSYFAVAIACAILAIFSIGLFLGIILSIVALILIGLSRDEFEHGTKGKVF